MQLFLIATLLSLASASPTPDKSMMATTAPQWTLQSFKRTCNPADTACTYAYSINTHTSTVTPCTYTVSGTPASRTSYNNIKCGGFTIGSSWSGQFGTGNGFSTLGVTDGALIVYPAYRDSQLVGGLVVSPDQSYAPQNLP